MCNSIVCWPICLIRGNTGDGCAHCNAITTFKTQFPDYVIEDLPRPDLGPNTGTFSDRNRAKTSQNIYITPNFLVLHFDENFMNILAKILSYICMKKMHKKVNVNMFHSHFCANSHDVS